MNSLSSINISPSVHPRGRCWVLDDTRPGHLNQSLALVRALELKNCPEIVSLQEAAPRARKLARNSHTGLLIGCGRRAGACSKEIKRVQPAMWSNIQILDPRSTLSGLDWVLVPHHDGVSGPQVINFLGALSKFDEQFLESARNQFPGFGELNSPRIVILVGAPTRRAPWRPADLQRWLEQLHEHAVKQGGTAILLNSHRTPRWANTLMGGFAAGAPHFYRHDAAIKPYAGILSFADRIWVTGDSVNMLAEACSTSKPVRALGGTHLRGRIRVCWQQFTQAKRLMDNWENPTQERYVPLREARRVASILRRRGALLGIEQAPP